MSKKHNIKDLTQSEIARELKNLGQASYRAEQIFRELYIQRSESFEQMTTLPLDLRVKLSENFILNSFSKVKKQTSSDGSIKYLFTLNDGKAVESVYMPWISDDVNKPIRTTLCISSQVGCAVDCQFCATGKLGFDRNLKCSEIVDQILYVEKDLDTKLTNIVFMGMGEPLLNYNQVLRSIDILTDSTAQLINRKRITVSTSGLVKQIDKLAELEKPVKLAISLHATTNGVRDKLIPINKKANIQDIMNSVENYYRKTKLDITYEYIPFNNLNDTIADAKRLAKLSKRVPSRINIIPFNDISFTNPSGFAATLKPTPISRIREFAQEIRKFGGTVIVRDTFGTDIDAACGQLALSDKKGI